jgi:hypothetical protein
MTTPGTPTQGDAIDALALVIAVVDGEGTVDVDVFCAVQETTATSTSARMARS